MTTSEAGAGGGRRVCFLFIAQPHQVLHSLPIALALAQQRPDYRVEIAATSPSQLDYVGELIRRLGAPSLPMRLLGPRWLRSIRSGGGSIPVKTPMLAANVPVLSTYDAVVTPERTTAILRRFGLRRLKLIYTQHGAGDREGPFEPRLRRFDLVMASGPKQYDRIIDEGLATPQTCAVVGYPKFDLVEALGPAHAPAFPSRRPIVLYNPHFKSDLSSWPQEGLRVLEQFAGDDRYNLIFAPHVRLFDGEHPDRERLAAFAGLPNIHIDLAGPAMIDMTYVRAADVYLGDVSSQIYEFLLTPRPCVFLNPHRIAWENDESFQAWRFGPVVERADQVLQAVDRSRAEHEQVYLPRQRVGLAETFDLRPDRSSSARAADAIIRTLEREA
jgi:hypothetical protein